MSHLRSLRGYDVLEATFTDSHQSGRQVLTGNIATDSSPSPTTSSRLLGSLDYIEVRGCWGGQGLCKMGIDSQSMRICQVADRNEAVQFLPFARVAVGILTIEPTGANGLLLQDKILE